MSTRSATTRYALLAAGWIAAAGIAAPAFAQTAAAPAAPHAAAGQVQTGPALTLLQDADSSLQAKKIAAARDKLELAETTLLNDRSRGEHGFAKVVSDVAAARNALDNRNPEAARLAIGQAITKLNTRTI